jgi:aryl-alcohol dehydrogenase-like predicted oxidoreductase
MAVPQGSRGPGTIEYAGGRPAGVPSASLASLGRRAPEGLRGSFSAVAWSLDPGPGAGDGRTAATIGALRRARTLGVTTFDVGSARVPGLAETALGRAFPDPDADVVTILPMAEDRLTSTAVARDRATLAETIRATLEASRERLAGAGRIVVEWKASLQRPIGGASGLEILETLRDDGLLAGVAVEAVPPALRRPPTDSRPPLLRTGPFSLLNPRLATEPAGPAGTTTPAWIVRDVLAGGRLDGTAFSLPSPPLRGGKPPRSIRALEAEFEPVRRLEFLTSGGRRTLAQAALRFVLAWPWVATASIPVPAAERLDEFARAAESPPLSPDEIERVVGAAATADAGRVGPD